MIQNIKLQGFRNFSKKEIEFSEKITVIVGPNGSGKTNVLESIFLLATGKSFKAKVEEEMINEKSEITRIQSGNLELVLSKGSLGKHKKLLVNGVGKRLIDFAGNLKVVLFGPWDMDLVTGSPSLRRKFLDTVLSQVDREYHRSLLSYEKGLRQRNRLLLRIRDENLPRNQLLFWDKLLIKNGDYVSKRREDLIDFINSQKYLNASEISLHYDKSAISESRLLQYEQEEVFAGTTLVGPHRDDFIFRTGENDLVVFGSRGQQRIAILWIKLAELNFVEKETSVKPVLLLDDIFSELDHDHRAIVWEIVQKQQSILTTSDPHFVIDSPQVTRIEF